MVRAAKRSFKRIQDHRSELFDAIAGLVDGASAADFPDRYGGFLKQWMPVKTVTVFEFRRGLQPKALYIEKDRTFDDDLKKYLGGLYLLDPMFDLYENEGRTGIFQLSRDDWSELSASEYYQSYFRYLGAKFEVGGLYEIEEDRCVHVSIKIMEADGDQIDRIVRIMGELEILTGSLFRLHLSARSESRGDQIDGRRHLHNEVSRAMRDFGSGVLTEREREIAILLLRGHSAKSIARLLDISPGTASIHRSNVYQKMGISGHGELFAIFLEQLTGM